MLHIQATIPTKNLPIKRSMARLFQGFVYKVLPEEHDGFKHPQSGKVFKRVNFRIRYEEHRFLIDFVALEEEMERKMALAVFKEGLKLGEVHIVDTTVEYRKREVPEGKMVVKGFVCASIKNALTKKKIFLEPGDYRHTEIITTNALQKYEALYGKPYQNELKITPVWQRPKPQTFWYEKSPYVAWEAKYEIEASKDMKHLLLCTGLGSDTMKNLGFLELCDG
jgi:CRISPR/Cas system endoribonuclease Cas6 (RAMP superfamily)